VFTLDRFGGESDPEILRLRAEGEGGGLKRCGVEEEDGSARDLLAGESRFSMGRFALLASHLTGCGDCSACFEHAATARRLSAAIRHRSDCECFWGSRLMMTFCTDQRNECSWSCWLPDPSIRPTVGVVNRYLLRKTKRFGTRGAKCPLKCSRFGVPQLYTTINCPRRQQGSTWRPRNALALERLQQRVFLNVPQLDNVVFGAGC
jgi:hypothetical protein